MSLPKEIAAVFRRHPDAKAKFESYGPSHQKEYIEYVTSAKRPDTRLKRADRLVMMLTGKKLATVYQPKTIPEVFGLKPDMKIKIIGRPDDYSTIMSNWQFKNEVKTSSTKLDFAHLFVKSQAELNKWLPRLKQQLKPSGMIWVSWLKKTSGITTDVNENTIRDLALNIGLVDIKVCAVSNVWSGLKLVIPISKRL